MIKVEEQQIVPLSEANALGEGKGMVDKTSFGQLDVALWGEGQGIAWDGCLMVASTHAILPECGFQQGGMSTPPMATGCYYDVILTVAWPCSLLSIFEPRFQLPYQLNGLLTVSSFGLFLV